ncbi:MAG: cell division protein ZapD [Gammaproteobacteria bacterium]|nr:cell division protein ZapD [Gammaproteobacteria bacterium]
MAARKNSQKQPKAIPEPQPELTVYEHPLVERLRTFLRLEHLFAQVNHHTAQAARWSSRHATHAVIEISDIVGRSDVKGELIKELERHAGTIQTHRDKPGVDPQAVSQLLSTIDGMLTELRSGSCHPGQRAKQDELVNLVRQRASIPGGTCSFDLPAFHNWLHRPHHQRAADLNTWMEDLRIIGAGIDTVLSDIRGSTTAKHLTVEGGFFQQQLDPNLPCQMIRVLLPATAAVFPEISGGRHRFTIRFLRQQSSKTRPEQVDATIEFDLQCCGI